MSGFGSVKELPCFVALLDKLWPGIRYGDHQMSSEVELREPCYIYDIHLFGYGNTLSRKPSQRLPLSLRLYAQ